MRRTALLAAFCAVTHALVNPFLPGWNPDPSILRVGKDYFVVTSTFEMFPGHPIYHSTDLVQWKLINHALTRPAQTGLYGGGAPPDGGIWAPTLRYHKGTFYLATGARHVYTPELRIPGRPFYVTTKDIFSGQWSDPTYIDDVGYDLDLFFDTNGDVYATWCSVTNFVEKIYGIYQHKIDVVTGNALTPSKKIFAGVLPNDAAARPEGPHLYLINGTYYLMIAEGGTDAPHRATVARGPSPSGPWEVSPHNPFIYNYALDPLAAVQWTGHADLVQTPKGDWYGVMLGARLQGEDRNRSHVQLGRESFMYPVTWTTDGWPIANGGKPILEHIPDVLYDKQQAVPYLNDFRSAADLDKDHTFYVPRTRAKKFAAVDKGQLVISGNAYNPSDRDAPALLLRRQSAYEETFETRLDGYSPANNFTEAGLSVWYGEMMHLDIGVTLDPEGSGKRVIVTRTLERPTKITYTPLKSANGNVRLRAVAKPTSYTLAFAEGNDEFTDTATVDSHYLSVPPTTYFFFKGTGFGVYNTGNGHATLVKARFDYWKQTPVPPAIPAA